MNLLRNIARSPEALKNALDKVRYFCCEDKQVNYLVYNEQQVWFQPFGEEVAADGIPHYVLEEPIDKMSIQM